MTILRFQRGHIAKSAAILLLVAAFLSPAFAEYQQTQTPHFRHEFYVQSGVLSKEEIEAATEAMKVVAGNVPDLKPVTSGRQTLPSGGRSFAFFDTSYRKVSDHAETATRVECRKSSYATPWSCEPPFIAVRITNDGVTREVGFSIKGNPPYGQPYLPDDPRTAGDIVEFVHSPCFAAKYAEAARPGDPQASASPSILGMFRSAGAIRVRLGERLAWEDYDLERTLGAQDGCAFRITHMDRPSDRALLREQELKRYEEKAAKARAEWRKKEQEMEAHALDSGRRRGVGLAFFYASLLAGLPALFLPGLVKKLGAGRW